MIAGKSREPTNSKFDRAMPAPVTGPLLDPGAARNHSFETVNGRTNDGDGRNLYDPDVPVL